MRILQVHNRHREQGGADAVVSAEAEQLTSAGHDVEQLLEPPADESGLGPVRMGLNAIWNRSACRTLDRHISAFRPDVVHVHTPFPLLSPAVLRTAHRAGCATVTTAHSFRYSCISGTCLREGRPCEDCVGSTLKLAGLRHRCYHQSIGASAALTVSLTGHHVLGTFRYDVDRFITLTAFARDLLIRDGTPAGRVVVKPNAVADPGAPAEASRRNGYALFVGRLVEEKGIRTLLEAWRSIGSTLGLYVAGDGPLRGVVDRAAADNPAIQALGWCSEQHIADLQRGARLTVVPSEWYEAGPPLVLLQALAAATPVVCCDLENISSDVLLNEAGRSFRTGDAVDLAATVVELLDRPDTLAEMGRNGRDLFERCHTPAASARALESIYRAAMRTRHPSHPPYHDPVGGR